MPVVTIKINGLDELQKKLESLPREVTRKLLREDLFTGADVMKEGIRDAAPKDTGFLSEHFEVKVKIARQDIEGVAFIGPAAHADYPDRNGSYRKKFIAKLKKTVEVGRISVKSVVRYLELGTIKMAARPFMRRGFDGSRNKTLDTLIQAIRDSLKKAAA